jgi:hypothetical protein
MPGADPDKLPAKAGLPTEARVNLEPLWCV